MMKTVCAPTAVTVQAWDKVFRGQDADNLSFAQALFHEGQHESLFTANCTVSSHIDAAVFLRYMEERIAMVTPELSGFFGLSLVKSPSLGSAILVITAIPAETGAQARKMLSAFASILGQLSQSCEAFTSFRLNAIKHEIFGDEVEATKPDGAQEQYLKELTSGNYASLNKALPGTRWLAAALSPVEDMLLA